MTSAFLDRAAGCLVGLACGDAVGTTLEFHEPGSFEPITDMIGGGPFSLEPGQWTDDTSMALCLAESLIHCNGFNAENQMNRYCNWMNYGIPSSTGTAFDIGNTVRAALLEYERTGDPYSGSADPHTAGNGSLMRLAPVPIFFFPDLEAIMRYSGESSRTTHGAAEAIEACQLFSEYLFNALSGYTRDQILINKAFQPAEPKLQEISGRNWDLVSGSEIRGSGYVVKSLEAALWCFASTNSYEEAILKAANLGDDADTTGAICGQIAGAYYGLSGIPTAWKQRLHDYSMIEGMAHRLVKSRGTL